MCTSHWRSRNHNNPNGFRGFRIVLGPEIREPKGKNSKRSDPGERVSVSLTPGVIQGRGERGRSRGVNGHGEKTGTSRITLEKMGAYWGKNGIRTSVNAYRPPRILELRTAPGPTAGRTDRPGPVGTTLVGWRVPILSTGLVGARGVGEKKRGRSESPEPSPGFRPARDRSAARPT